MPLTLPLTRPSSDTRVPSLSLDPPHPHPQASHHEELLPTPLSYVNRPPPPPPLRPAAFVLVPSPTCRSVAPPSSHCSSVHAAAETPLVTTGAPPLASRQGFSRSSADEACPSRPLPALDHHRWPLAHRQHACSAQGPCPNHPPSRRLHLLPRRGSCLLAARGSPVREVRVFQLLPSPPRRNHSIR